MHTFCKDESQLISKWESLKDELSHLLLFIYNWYSDALLKVVFVVTEHRECDSHPYIEWYFIIFTVFPCWWWYYLSPADRLRGFNITVLNAGIYKRCGATGNEMSKVTKKTFQCEPKTIGVTVQIAIKGTRTLNLCEVLVYGKGTAELNISIANNIR